MIQVRGVYKPQSTCYYCFKERWCKRLCLFWKLTESEVRSRSLRRRTLKVLCSATYQPYQSGPLPFLSPSPLLFLQYILLGNAVLVLKIKSWQGKCFPLYRNKTKQKRLRSTSFKVIKKKKNNLCSISDVHMQNGMEKCLCIMNFATFAKVLHEKERRQMIQK